MLVDVVELRRDGKRLPAEVVRAAQPVRGILQIHDARPGMRWWRPGAERPLLAGLLRPGSFDYVLAPLDRARVVKIDSRGMLVVGLQEKKHFNRDIGVERQAWWVRVVVTSEA
jgi:hypothetical protein